VGKVFIISLHRCATHSTARFLENSGFSVLHWAADLGGIDLQSRIIGAETDPAKIVQILKPALNLFDAAADVPLPAIYRELDAVYPDAKFILVRRNPSDWVRSVRQHCHSRLLDPYERAQYWRYLADRPAKLNAVPDVALEQMCLRHYREVAGHFDDRGRLLSVDLGDPDIGRKLGAFLNVPTTVFPHVDTEAEKAKAAARPRFQVHGLRYTITIKLRPVG
jgi:hypothetical protein